jgi:hypothetical protein
VLTKLHLVGLEGNLIIAPAAILNRRVFKRNNEVSIEVLVQRANLLAEKASWEDYPSLRQQFLDVCLEDDKFGE